MTHDTHEALMGLSPPNLNVAEISGDSWRHLEWGAYAALEFPDFDLCHPPAELPGPFDLVLCEQVLEHVEDPLTAVDTLRRLCRVDGHVFVSTPFLVRLHGHPDDFWRFTPNGLRRLLEARGLEPLWVRSWGNREAILSTFDAWTYRLPWQTLENDENLPLVVWSLARPRAA